MEEIAATAGSWKAVVYDYFPSKVELYVALLESFRIELLAATATCAQARDSGGRRAWRASFEAFFVFVEERPDAVRLLFLETPGEPELAAASSRVQSGAAMAIAKMLASDPALLSAESDRGQGLEMLATMIKGAVHALAAWWREHPPTVPCSAIVEQATRLIWAGIEAFVCPTRNSRENSQQRRSLRSGCAAGGAAVRMRPARLHCRLIRGARPLPRKGNPVLRRGAPHREGLRRADRAL